MRLLQMTDIRSYESDPEVKNPIDPKHIFTFEKIEFKNVCFKYPI